MNTNESGFTLIELIISTVMIGLIVTIFANFIANSLNNYTRDQTKTELQANTKGAVESVAKDIRQATLVEASNGNPDTNSPSSPSNNYGWTSSVGSSNQNATLVLAIPARDASGNLLYQDGLHTQLYTDDVAYYIDATSKILYRRIIKNPNAAGDAAVTTCPPGYATGTCPADANVVANVANLITTYFDGTNSMIASPASAQSIQITLNQTRTVGHHTYSSTYTTQATLR